MNNLQNNTSNNTSSRLKWIMPVAISLVLAIVLLSAAAFFAKAQVDNVILDRINGEFAATEVQDAEVTLSGLLESEAGVPIDLSKIYNVFLYFPLLHGIDIEIAGSVGGEDGGGLIAGELELNADNFSAALLWIPAVVLLISGAVLGRLVHRNEQSILLPLLVFSALYGLVVAVTSFIAAFRYEETIDIFFSTIAIEVNGTFSLVESFVTGTLLAIAIAGTAALLAAHGTKTLSYIRRLPSAVQYLVVAGFVALAGLALISIGSAVFLSASPATEELLGNSSPLIALILSLAGLWTWHMSHLIPLKINSTDPVNPEGIIAHPFASLSESQQQFILPLFGADSLPIWMEFSFLVPALLLGLAGFLLYRTHRLSVIELLKFSVIYAALLAITQRVTNLSFSANLMGESNYFQIGTDFFLAFLISAVFALVFISAGGFLKRFTSKASIE